jgi:hypothetical protein
LVSQVAVPEVAAYATGAVAPNSAAAVTILPLWLKNSRRLLFSFIVVP